MIYFFTLKPNDYNGLPELDVLFPDSNSNSDFPKIPTEEEVKHLFFEAGYSTYDAEDEIQHLGGLDKYFQKYGNLPVYYAIYVIVVDEEIISSSGFSLRDHLGELINLMEYRVIFGGPEGLVKEMKDSPWVKEIFYYK